MRVKCYFTGDLVDSYLNTIALASALGARALAGQGVLPTRLSAVDEAGSIDVLCADKTGTLTANQLRVTNLWVVPWSTDA